MEELVPDDPPIFTAEAPHLQFVLFGDRIEVAARKRRQVIALSDVAEVVVSRRPKKLVITTGEGKHYEYLLGFDVEAARAAVTGALRRYSH